VGVGEAVGGWGCIDGLRGGEDSTPWVLNGHCDGVGTMRYPGKGKEASCMYRTPHWHERGCTITQKYCVDIYHPTFKSNDSTFLQYQVLQLNYEAQQHGQPSPLQPSRARVLPSKRNIPAWPCFYPANLPSPATSLQWCRARLIRMLFATLSHASGVAGGRRAVLLRSRLRHGVTTASRLFDMGQEWSAVQQGCGSWCLFQGYGRRGTWLHVLESRHDAWPVI